MAIINMTSKSMLGNPYQNMLNQPSSVNLDKLAKKEGPTTLSPPKIVKYDPVSLNDLKSKTNARSPSKMKTNYDVIYQTKSYQIVKNKTINGEDD